MKIQLKRLHQKDLFSLTSIVSKDIAESAYIEWPFDKQVAIKFICDFNTWGIWLNGSILAGAVEIKPSMETAYFVADIYQGQGIATEAVKQCIVQFSDSQLWCVINPDNVASQRVAQKAGLRVQYIR